MIEDSGGIRTRVLGLALDRRRWPAIPAVILVTTLVVLALSGLGGGLPASVVSTPTPGTAATQASPTLANTPTPAASAAEPSVAPSAPATTIVPPPTRPPSAAPGTPRPQPSLRTYRVRSGDTLGAIASRFGTTVSALVSLNHLPDAGRLSVGQVLLIP